MSKQTSAVRVDIEAYRLQWRLLSFYERFEQIVATS
jgi:hypothetical protein